jgi:gas vesicle protein
MNEQLYIAIIEMFIGIVIEGILLSMVFAFIANQTSEKQNKALKNEMSNIEIQNKFIYDQLKKEISDAKAEIISQIKESECKK